MYAVTKSRQRRRMGAFDRLHVLDVLSLRTFVYIEIGVFVVETFSLSEKDKYDPLSDRPK